MSLTTRSAEIIVHTVLSNYDEILGISIMNMNGNMLAADSKEAFRETFLITEDRANYGGTLAVEALSVVNETRNVFGRTKAIITIHENCKLMLLPIPSFQLLVGVVLERSANAENHKITNQIEILVADILDQSTNMRRDKYS
jgi:hypothetical protein